MKKLVVSIFVFFTISSFAQEGFHLLTTMSGDSVGDQFSVVSHIGDVNADGFDDVIVGAPGGDYAKLFFGGAAFDTIPDLIFKDYKQFNCQFGCSIAGDGDVNDDGYPDIIIGASSTWIGPSFPFEIMTTGAAYVYFGGPTIDTTADLTLIVGDWLSSTGWYYEFGRSVAIPGDLNGDGYEDFVVVAPNDDYDAHGRVYIYYGGPHLDEQWDILLEGEEVFDNFGFSLSKVGDMNNDGPDDVLIGAPMSNNTVPNKIYQGGKAYLVYGGNEINLNNSIEFIGDTNSYGYGRFVNGLGDVNGDSISDLGIMGGQYFKIISGSNGYILLEISRVNNWFGNYQSICSGDINIDNYNDIIISLEDTSNDYAGKIEAYLGGSNLISTPNFSIEGNQPQLGFGSSLAFIGDINSDHKPDIGIGQWYTGYPDTIGIRKTFIYSFGDLNSVDGEKDINLNEYVLYQNYPNPFNPITSIQYAIGSKQTVTLKIYDVLGREVATLVNEEKPAGNYEVKFDASNIASGIYYYQIKARKFVQTKKMILLK